MVAALHASKLCNVAVSCNLLVLVGQACYIRHVHYAVLSCVCWDNCACTRQQRGCGCLFFSS